MDKAVTIKSRIVEAVIQDIIDGRYSSNDIITEKELIERFNVSKSPVRDALIELCANEVLKNIPRYGYQIVHIGREKMHEMMEFRFILESYCLRKSIRYVTPQNIERRGGWLLLVRRRDQQPGFSEHHSRCNGSFCGERESGKSADGL